MGKKKNGKVGEKIGILEKWNNGMMN